MVSINHEISLLYRQVNYLLRQGKALGLLDLDVFMNRTHTLYDLLCSINLGEEPADMDLPLGTDAFTELFGGETQDGRAPESEAMAADGQAGASAGSVAEPENAAHTVTAFSPTLETAPTQENDPMEAELPEENQKEFEAQTVEDGRPEETKPTDGKPLGDEFGFLFRFENVEDTATPGEQPIISGGKVVHVMEAVPEEEIPERDRVHGEDLVKDNPFEMPVVEDEQPAAPEDEMERQHMDAVSDFFNQDDAGFELSGNETLGDKMLAEDRSLAAKWQNNPVHDLKSAIGINDKFLFVNELFGGSMEKYNKSIENLNDLKTLNGTLIYLNELKIELQWNSSNEAYQKLTDLVKRKFE